MAASTRMHTATASASMENGSWPGEATAANTKMPMMMPRRDRASVS